MSPESPNRHDVDDNPGLSSVCQIVHGSGDAPISEIVDVFNLSITSSSFNKIHQYQLIFATDIGRRNFWML